MPIDRWATHPWWIVTKGFNHRQLGKEMITKQFCYSGVGDSLYELSLERWNPKTEVPSHQQTFESHPSFHELKTLTHVCLLRYHGQGNSEAAISKCLPKPTAVMLGCLTSSHHCFYPLVHVMEMGGLACAYKDSTADPLSWRPQPGGETRSWAQSSAQACRKDVINA